jgi:hypothetical protein
MLRRWSAAAERRVLQTLGRFRKGMRAGLAITLLVVTIACGPAGEDALAGRAFLGVVPEAEVVGTWSWPSADSDSLQLRPDHTCTITPSMAERLDKCGDTYSPSSAVSEPCAWAVEKKQEGEAVVVTFHAPHSGSRSVGFGAYRHTAQRQVALLGSCGSGDAYALRRPAGQSSAQ